MGIIFNRHKQPDETTRQLTELNKKFDRLLDEGPEDSESNDDSRRSTGRPRRSAIEEAFETETDPRRLQELLEADGLRRQWENRNRKSSWMQRHNPRGRGAPRGPMESPELDPPPGGIGGLLGLIMNPGSMIGTVRKYAPYIKMAGLDKKYLGGSLDDIMPVLEQIQNNPEAMAMLGQQIGASFTGILKGVAERLTGKGPTTALALPPSQATPAVAQTGGKPVFYGPSGQPIDPTKPYNPATMQNVG